MSFRITGLPAEQFSHLFSLSDEQLAAQGAVRRIAQHPAPCRISLTDATPGDERFYAVYADRPFTLDERLFAGLRGGGALSDLASAAVVLHKAPSPL